ncbi:MAG: sulfite exporter TauE/SafE family protein, partial [Myxococcales bacterium]|nr:sulfite exporter TauE/SafE family protein [Myxococcales bacterium]
MSSAAAVGGSGMDADANRAPDGRGHLYRLAAIGLIAGAFSALFGVGGGVVIVPLLILLLDYDPARATATSLAAIIVTASAAAASHALLDNVRWSEALLIGIPAMIGVTAGVALKNRISSRALTLGFAAFLVVVAGRIALGGEAGGLEDPGAGEFALIALLGITAGAVAGLFGVGGGTVFV